MSKMSYAASQEEELKKNTESAEYDPTFDYVKYDEQSIELQDFFKTHIRYVKSRIDKRPDGRAKSTAITKLEECYMWIGKMIRDEQIQRNGSAELQEERKNG